MRLFRRGPPADENPESFREGMEAALRPVEDLYGRGKRDVFSMTEDEFAEYRREVAAALRGVPSPPKS